MRTIYLKDHYENKSKVNFLNVSIISSALVALLLGAFGIYKSTHSTLKATPVSQPQITKTETATGSAEPKVTLNTPGERVILEGSKWVPQTFNNCVPATVSMALQHFGFQVTQEETKKALRTNGDDKNVFLSEVIEYLKNFNLEAKTFYNGNIQTLKLFSANGIYVIAEDWLRPNEDIGHVIIIRGYDDKESVIIADDSYFAVGKKFNYATFDNDHWKAFNRSYTPVYRKDQEPIVKAIVGENWNEEKMFANSAEFNRKKTEENPNDLYSWFNLGTSYFGLEKYTEAKDAFEKSQSLGWPKRMLWYQIQPIQTYNKLGEFEKTLTTARLGLAGYDSFAEVHYEVAVAYLGLGQKENAKKELQKALNYAPNLSEAKTLLESL